MKGEITLMNTGTEKWYVAHLHWHNKLAVGYGTDFVKALADACRDIEVINSMRSKYKADIN